MFRTRFRACIIDSADQMRHLHAGVVADVVHLHELAISARLTVSFLVISSDKGLALVNPVFDQGRLQRRMQAAMQRCEAPARGRGR